MNPQGDQEPAGNPGADAGTSPAPLDEPRDLMPEAPRRENPVVAPRQPKVVEPTPEIRREPTDEPQPEPKLTPAEPKAPAPESKPRPEDENLFEAVSAVGSAWRVQRRFAVGAAAAEGPVTPDSDRAQPVTHLEQSDLKPVPRVPFDPAAEARRLRATR